jgi:HAMP domain-containing protein
MEEFPMRLNPKQWSLATKWSLMLTALALGPLLATIRFSYSSASTQLLQQAVTSLSNSSADAAASLDDALGERVRQAQFLASLPSVQRYIATPITQRAGALAAVQADFKTLQANYPYLETIELLDAQGVVVYSTTGMKGLEKDAAMLQTVQSGDVYMAGLRPTEGRPDPSLVIAAPIGKGAQAGVLRTQSSPQFLLQRVTRDGQRQGEGAIGFLFDEKGAVIARGDMHSGAAVPTLEPGGKLTLADGSLYYAQATRLDGAPWSYVLAMPEAELRDQLTKQKSQAMLLAFGVSLIIGALARVLALGFTRPLTKMAAATRALAEADLTHEVKKSDRADELGQLESAFAEAYGQLRRLVARMRLSSILVAEAADHIHQMTATSPQVSMASEKLSVVAKDLERQVIHFKV